jgi:hypothetical protein
MHDDFQNCATLRCLGAAFPGARDTVNCCKYVDLCGVSESGARRYTPNALENNLLTYQWLEFAVVGHAKSFSITPWSEILHKVGYTTNFDWFKRFFLVCACVCQLALWIFKHPILWARIVVENDLYLVDTGTLILLLGSHNWLKGTLQKTYVFHAKINDVLQMPPERRIHWFWESTK